jgi:hypothetical protein
MAARVATAIQPTSSRFISSGDGVLKNHPHPASIVRPLALAAVSLVYALSIGGCNSSPDALSGLRAGLGDTDDRWPYPRSSRSEPSARGSVVASPAQGIVYRTFTRASPPYRAHTVEVDLTTWGASVVATSSAERGTKTSTFAQNHGCLIAINGGFFNEDGSFNTWGEAVSAGIAWPSPRPLRREDSGLVAIGVLTGVPTVQITDPRATAASLSSWMRAVVSEIRCWWRAVRRVRLPATALSVRRFPSETLVRLRPMGLGRTWAVACVARALRAPASDTCRRTDKPKSCSSWWRGWTRTTLLTASRSRSLPICLPRLAWSAPSTWTEGVLRRYSFPASAW